jgi:hypothetical protein
MPDVSTIGDRSTWVADPADPARLTHPGIPGWVLDTSNPNKVRICGLVDGIEEEPLMAAPSFDDAVALIAYMHGK